MSSGGVRETPLTPEQQAIAQRWFEAVDADRDGHVALSEVLGLARRIGLPAEAIDPARERIALDELLALLGDARNEPLRDALEPDLRLRDAFARYDRDGDGHITAVEFRALAASLGQEITDALAEEMVRAIDLDGDGQIDFAEFAKMGSD
jgi:calmodulin